MLCWSAGGVLTEADIEALLLDIEAQVMEEIQAELAELERQEQEQMQHEISMAEQHMQQQAAQGEAALLCWCCAITVKDAQLQSSIQQLRSLQDWTSATITHLVGLINCCRICGCCRCKQRRAVSCVQVVPAGSAAWPAGVSC